MSDRDRCTTDGKPPREGWEDKAAPAPINEETGQHEAYWVLCEEERAKGFEERIFCRRCGHVEADWHETRRSSIQSLSLPGDWMDELESTGRLVVG